MKKTNFFLLLGFSLFLLAILGIILNLVGVSLLVFKTLDSQGFVISLSVKLILLTIGLMLVYYAQVIKK